MSLEKIKSYLRLSRLHSGILSGLAPVLVAVATGEQISFSQYLILFIIGILFHIFLFVYNEICDYSIDASSDHLKDKPLVEGSVAVVGAKNLVYLVIVLIFIFTFLFYYDKVLFLLPLMLLALGCGAFYDKKGKYFPHADYFLAGSIFFLGLYGGLAVADQLSILVLVVSSLAFLQTLIQNIVAGLKDVDHDFISGGKSTALRLGVKTYDGSLNLPKVFLIYVLCLKVVYLFFVLIPFFLDLIVFEVWQLFFVFMLLGLTVVLLVRILTFSVFDREKLMRMIGFHEMFAFMIIPFMLFAWIGVGGFVFLVFFPIIWLGVFLMVLYGGLMPKI